MTQNGRGATKWGKAKNGTASNRDYLFGYDFSLASRESVRLNAFASRKCRPVRLLLKPMGMPLSVPAKNVMAISGDCFRQGAFPSIAEKANQSTPLTGREQNRDLGVVFAEFDRVWPVAGLTLALMATVSSIGLLGYVAIKLF